jgi:hypothetical protein
METQKTLSSLPNLEKQTNLHTNVQIILAKISKQHMEEG